MADTNDALPSYEALNFYSNFREAFESTVRRGATWEEHRIMMSTVKKLLYPPVTHDQRSDWALQLDQLGITVVLTEDKIDGSDVATITLDDAGKVLDTLEEARKVDVLAGNTFGITSSDAPVEEKLLRLAALVPMALEVEKEARATILRLRAENEVLRQPQSELGA